MKLPSFVRRLADMIRWRPGEPRIYVSPRQAGVLVTEDTAMTLPEWWACVSVLSRAIASLPWGVYQRSARGREEVHGQISWLLNSQPNPEMTAFSFREAMVAHVLNWGNAYAEIQRDLSGRVVALWILTPDRVCPDRDDAGALIYRVSGVDGAERILRPDQIYHIHGLGFDGLVGYSPVQMAARALGIGLAQDTFTQAFYANGTVLGTMVELPGGLSPEQIEQTEGYYNDKHRGPDKAFKVKVSPSGTKVHAMGMPLNDAQFIESRQLSITTAARLLGIPPHKIADLSRSTNNNIEHQGIEFVTDAVVPFALRFEQEANVKLFGTRAMGRVYTKMTVASLMRGDSKARAEFYRTMTQIGAMTINDVLALEDMNGIGPAGDQRLVQLNQTTLEYLVANPGVKAAEPTPAPAPSPEDDPAEDDEDDDKAPPAPSNVISREARAWWNSEQGAEWRAKEQA